VTRGMHILTVVGARPQFIKATALSRAIRDAPGDNISETIIHTGQHFDENMSGSFFKELDIPTPKYNLGIASVSHGAMTGRMLESIEEILQKEQPDLLLVYGDTNSTLAGALAASKLHIPVAHIEAGLRSFNNIMPEEVNRTLTDKISSLLFCPTTTSVQNLLNEGIVNGVYNVGDVMYDISLYYRDKAKEQIELSDFNVESNKYSLCTIHRAETTSNVSTLSGVLEAIRTIAFDQPVVLPLHPRTRQLINSQKKEKWLQGITVIEPVSYLEMQRLEMSANLILTDSGGIQKEAFFHGVPCITMRSETEWVETVELGWNQIVGTAPTTILQAYQNVKAITPRQTEFPYGTGQSATQILSIIQEYL
jgi:UDP-GlcNAc3NAcA epimerase